jgi:uncharacterized protein with PQ loop repeat
MTASQIIGPVATFYGVGGAFAVLLQARQMLDRGTSCEVSARFFTLHVGGYAIWLLYGVSIESVPMVVVHAIGLVLGAITLAVALTLRGSLARPSTWNSCASASDSGDRQGDTPSRAAIDAAGVPGPSSGS